MLQPQGRNSKDADNFDSDDEADDRWLEAAEDARKEHQ